MDNVDGDFTPQEKAAYVAFRLAEGQSFTTQEVAEAFGITRQGANQMLNRISRVIPICSEEEHPHSRWRRLS